MLTSVNNDNNNQPTAARQTDRAISPMELFANPWVAAKWRRPRARLGMREKKCERPGWIPGVTLFLLPITSFASHSHSIVPFNSVQSICTRASYNIPFERECPRYYSPARHNDTTAQHQYSSQCSFALFHSIRILLWCQWFGVNVYRIVSKWCSHMVIAFNII